jgi:hypothetical protein
MFKKLSTLDVNQHCVYFIIDCKKINTFFWQNDLVVLYYYILEKYI